MASRVYAHPHYYDIAYSFVDVPGQVDLFENYLRAHSRLPVRRVLDLCCGPATQLREFARRGYGAVGLDCHPIVLQYAREHAVAAGADIEFVQADMTDFTLAEPVDFAFILMGSTAYLGSNEGLLAHLSCMARAVAPGGLYLLENVADEWAPAWEPQVWEMERDGVLVRSTYQIEPADALRQTVIQTVSLQVNDRGRTQTFTDRDEQKLFFPQEFAALVGRHGAFEFLGYFERTGPSLHEPFSAARVRADHNALLRRRDA
jgi:SAM-dependent methyltransferase